MRRRTARLLVVFCGLESKLFRADIAVSATGGELVGVNTVIRKNCHFAWMDLE